MQILFWAFFLKIYFWHQHWNTTGLHHKCMFWYNWIPDVHVHAVVTLTHTKLTVTFHFFNLTDYYRRAGFFVQWIIFTLLETTLLLMWLKVNGIYRHYTICIPCHSNNRFALFVIMQPWCSCSESSYRAGSTCFFVLLYSDQDTVVQHPNCEEFKIKIKAQSLIQDNQQ